MLIEVKRTSTAIDLRGVLPSLADALKDEPSTSQAICVLQETRLTQDRLRQELANSVRP